MHSFIQCQSNTRGRKALNSPQNIKTTPNSYRSKSVPFMGSFSEDKTIWVCDADLNTVVVVFFCKPNNIIVLEHGSSYHYDRGNEIMNVLSASRRHKLYRFNIFVIDFSFPSHISQQKQRVRHKVATIKNSLLLYDILAWRLLYRQWRISMSTVIKS